MSNSIEFTRINNNASGNPRYVCHFLQLLTREELDRKGDEWIPIAEKYAIALKRSRKLGGRKFHNRQYGGGIVFSCYGTDELEREIKRVIQADEGVAA